VLEPANSTNLEQFIARYKSVGAYYFTCGFQKPGSLHPEFVLDRLILKREFNVRHAWEIGFNDLDLAGLRETDDPIIPEGRENAPIVEIMRKLKSENS
jgi:hypothetical protein